MVNNHLTIYPNLAFLTGTLNEFVHQLYDNCHCMESFHQLRKCSKYIPY